MRARQLGLLVGSIATATLPRTVLNAVANVKQLAEDASLSKLRGSYGLLVDIGEKLLDGMARLEEEDRSVRRLFETTDQEILKPWSDELYYIHNARLINSTCKRASEYQELRIRSMEQLQAFEDSLSSFSALFLPIKELIKLVTEHLNEQGIQLPASYRPIDSMLLRIDPFLLDWLLGALAEQYNEDIREPFLKLRYTIGSVEKLKETPPPGVCYNYLFSLKVMLADACDVIRRFLFVVSLIRRAYEKNNQMFAQLECVSALAEVVRYKEPGLPSAQVEDTWILLGKLSKFWAHYKVKTNQHLSEGREHMSKFKELDLLAKN
ncbi:hypothetical protein PAPHI01_0554 [Pancytospora philotis]|nr:hypothetical protein PAPHI01_0554 [Pancytospora philotis]